MSLNCLVVTFPRTAHIIVKHTTTIGSMTETPHHLPAEQQSTLATQIGVDASSS